MKTIMHTGARLIERECLRLSPSGNPRARCVFETAEGAILTATTATDAAAGYVVENWRYHKFADIRAHVTRSGAVIIDYISNCRDELGAHVCRPERCARCFYHFVGDIGEASGRHFCGLVAGGRVSFGQDARELVAGAPDFCYGWRD